MTGLSALELCATPDAAVVWKCLAESCPDAWFWHSWSNMEFNFVAAQNYEVRNLSFFVLLDGRPVGFVPLMVQRTQIGDYSGLDASYYSGPLPWPAFLPVLPNFEMIEDYAFQELERRARQAGVGRIRLRLSPPLLSGNEQRRFARAISVHRYLDSSYISHSLNVQQDTLANVRERYRRYVKKFTPRYELAIEEGDAVTPQLEEIYFRLHVKDSGGQFRSRESYRFQANLARNQEAFYVTATRRGRDVIAGMLLVSVYKAAAYDNSVAVDPDFQDEYVSHLLKWTAIESLLARGVQTYELGDKPFFPTMVCIPSAKSYGISHFKEGWSKGVVKTVMVAEKFLDLNFLQTITIARSDELKAYFVLG
jgi:hypothetical protein